MATISEALAIAMQHHQAGRLQAAEQIYRQILAVEPNQAETIHLLGLIAHQVGKHAIAVEYIERAIELKGTVVDFHNNLGAVLNAQGKVDQAVACYRRALELKPDFAEAHNNLGNASRDQGKLDDAVGCYRQALELKPDYADAHNNLGVALRDQGKLEEAVVSYRQALKLKRDFAEAHNNLGNALRDHGRVDEAVACYRRALELKPDYADAHNNLGGALRKQSKLDEAVACYRQALKLKPHYADAHNNLGNALREQSKLGEAVACYRWAVELKPDYAEAHTNLGDALTEQGKLDEAVACYRRALELKPDYGAALNNLGGALREQGKLDEAIACYRLALKQKPDCANAHNNLGCAFEEIGDLHAAEDSFRAALRHNSRFALAHFHLAELLRGKLADKDLAAQRQLLEQMALTDAQRLLLHFGLAQVLDARGEYAEAAQHLVRGNALQRSEWRKCGQDYDAKEHESFITQMIRVFTSDFFERVSGFGLASEVPVFVFGLPRSGTTLTEQILASHSQVFGAGELHLARDDFLALGMEPTDAHAFEALARLDSNVAQRVAQRHLSQLRTLNSTAACVVDKMPDNYLYFGLLAVLFPRAKFIHCRRDLRDVSVSCWMTHFRHIRWANDQEDIAARFYVYQRTMEHWRKVLPVPLLEVDYEETVADLEGVARKLVAWCGLGWEPTCLEFHKAKRCVRTASVVPVRQPVFRTSVGRWTHYERALISLFARLETERCSP
jgi:tetratricopeptide (TPR) repeat protein